MKLCKCGCGQEVTKPQNTFLHGHHSRMPPSMPPIITEDEDQMVLELLKHEPTIEEFHEPEIDNPTIFDYSKPIAPQAIWTHTCGFFGKIEHGQRCPICRERIIHVAAWRTAKKQNVWVED